jgi:hypothetical protein
MGAGRHGEKQAWINESIGTRRRGDRHARNETGVERERDRYRDRMTRIQANSDSWRKGDRQVRRQAGLQTTSIESKRNIWHRDKQG